MTYEEIKELPADALIKVKMNYTYSVEDITPQIWAFFLAHGADIENEYDSNDKITEDEIQ